MLARILFLLLLVMNLAAGAWWYWRVQAPQPPVVVADSDVPSLVLLSERDSTLMAQAAQAADSAQAAGDPNLPPAVCAALGPFETQSDLRRGMDLLTPQVKRIQYQESSSVTTRGYWVYLPAFTTRDAALKSARQLNAAGVRDYYVVTAGDHENTVSLGLFRDRDNASRRQAQIAALGFPARLEERTEVERAFWIEYERDAPEPPDYSQLPGAAELTLKPRSCG
ncbi:MAG: SPOR domain-containing protein [Lysobacterales bacterium]